MKITKIVAAFFVGSVISFFSVANASGDYVFRTENSYNSESMNVADYSGYSHVYSFAVVSKGAMGYQNINNFDDFYHAMARCDKEKQLTDEGTELFNLMKQLRPTITKLSKTALTPVGIGEVNRLGTDFGKSRAKLINSKATYDKEINIQFVYDGDPLGLETGEKFVLGITNNLPEDNVIVYDEIKDENTLAFFYNTEYKNYLNNYPDLEKALGKMRVDKQYKSYIESVLPRILKKVKIDELVHLGFSTGTSRIDDKDFVNDLYLFYQILPNIDPFLAQKYSSLMDTIIRPNEREYFAKMEDHIAYYKFGPGFKNNRIGMNSGKRIVKGIVDDLVAINSEEPVKVMILDARALISLESYLFKEEFGDGNTSEKVSGELGGFSVSDYAPLNSLLIFDLYKNADSKYFARVTLNGKTKKINKEWDVAKNSDLYDLSMVLGTLDNEESAEKEQE